MSWTWLPHFHKTASPEDFEKETYKLEHLIWDLTLKVYGLKVYTFICLLLAYVECLKICSRRPRGIRTIYWWPLSIIKDSFVPRGGHGAFKEVDLDEISVLFSSISSTPLSILGHFCLQVKLQVFYMIFFAPKYHSVHQMTSRDYFLEILFCKISGRT